MHIEPFDMKYLNDYFNGFNEEITKYQWPEPCENIEASKDMLQEFMDEMEKSCICGSVAVTLPLFSAGKEKDENIRGAGC